MHLIDMRSVLLLGALISLTLAGVMVYFSLARKTFPGFHCWTAGFVCIGAGSALVAMRGILPDFVTIVAANTMVAAMPFLLKLGLEAFSGRTFRKSFVDALIFGLFIAVFVWATYYSPSLLVRTLSISLVMLLYFSRGLYVAVRWLPDVLGGQSRLLDVMISWSILSMLVRIGVTLQEKSASILLMDAGTGQGIAVIMTILSVTGIMTSLLILNTHRIENDLHEANRRIAEIADKDGLTGLYNRRYFDMILTKEFNRLQRSRLPISLLMADIDYFKNYNDTYGHQAGDDCLRAIADVFRKTGGRVADTAARYGGEEFVMVLPETDLPGARSVADTILDRIHMMALEHQSSDAAEIVTISIGVATVIPDKSMEPKMLIELADKALYECKHNGRNQVRTNTMDSSGDLAVGD